MSAPAGVNMVSAVVCNGRPNTITANGFVVININILSLLIIEPLKHTVYRFSHGKIAPASFTSPNRVLVIKIIGRIAVFSNPTGARGRILLLYKSVFLKPLAQHCRVVVLIGNIGWAPVRGCVAGGIGVFLMCGFVEAQLQLIGGVGFQLLVCAHIICFITCHLIISLSFCTARSVNMPGSQNCQPGLLTISVIPRRLQAETNEVENG